MATDHFSESALARARRTFWSTVTGAGWTWTILTIAGLAGVGFGTYYSFGHRRWASVLIGVAASAGTIAIGLAFIFVLLAAYGLRDQRNEAREALFDTAARLDAATAPPSFPRSQFRTDIIGWFAVPSPRGGPKRRALVLSVRATNRDVHHMTFELEMYVQSQVVGSHRRHRSRLRELPDTTNLPFEKTRLRGLLDVDPQHTEERYVAFEFFGGQLFSFGPDNAFAPLPETEVLLRVSELFTGTAMELQVPSLVAT